MLPRRGLAIVGSNGTEKAMTLRDRLKNALGLADSIPKEESAAKGKGLRASVPREDHALWAPAHDRPDPVQLLREQGESRVQALLPLRYERMSASAFTFYRGGALIMASDLADTPVTGIQVQLCGDAHISNFGLFSSPERRTVFDINDFDETLPGPWEWDVKRLAASVEICGRDNGLARNQRKAAVLACVQGYREGMRAFADMGNLDVWYAHLDVDTLREKVVANMKSASAKKGAAKASDKKTDAKSGAQSNAKTDAARVSGPNAAAVKATNKIIDKAKAKNSTRAIQKMTEIVDGKLRIISDPPVIVPLRELIAENMGEDKAEKFDEAAIERLVHAVLAEYRLTLTPDKRRLIDSYTPVDVAHKVVGVGSVGTRAWIVVMRGADEEDPLVLQIKEAQASVLERFVGKSEYKKHGQRVVAGQRAMQSASDMLLGWCSIPDAQTRKNKHYYVRQLWDGKGSIDLSKLDSERLKTLSRACGRTLAHAHARTGDRFAIAAYLGKSDKFDKAIAQFASIYADQNELDYARFMQAFETGEI